MRWGPAESLVIFDVIFFGNYGLGWLLTWLYNPVALWDNNVTRVFAVYNICIGVDSWPARPVCATIFTVAFAFFLFSSYLHWVKAFFDGGIPLWLSTLWLSLAVLLGLTFTLTFAVPPVGERDTLIHVLGFALGLSGAVLLKLYAVLEFFLFVKYDCKDWRGMAYIWSMILQVVFMGFMIVVLTQSLATTDLSKYVAPANPVPEHIGMDHKGNVLVFLALVGPAIQWFLAPYELRNTAQIIDATPNMVESEETELTSAEESA